MLAAGKRLPVKKCSKSSAPRFVSTNTSVKSFGFEDKIFSKKECLLCPSTHSIFCVIERDVLPTLPTKIACQVLNFLGKCCRKHHCLSLANSGHVSFFNYISNLGLEAHVQHPVSLI
ncbi:hypothetical protein BpHYR1_015935 [Brachionus plicatilis]|uniref:Uncharacterized protein n=1 Tax=Brachionus plicatilis TaxID=10195 RepID=A0A3M7S5S8_BRAPC|nr:hypothetical protein BpHYR1_015935 [Brachionus plicatilis]